MDEWEFLNYTEVIEDICLIKEYLPIGMQDILQSILISKITLN